MIARGQWIALAAAGAVAAAMPLLLLPAPAPPAPAAPGAMPRPLAPAPQPALADVYARPLFAAAPDADAELPADAPALVGIVGRIDRDAVALVRTAEGSSRTLPIGESVDGWRLESLAIDAAFFTRGRERVRVPLPEGE